MSGVVSEAEGGSYHYWGDPKAGEQEYKRFRGCLAQLLDESTMVGDVEGKWIIFKETVQKPRKILIGNRKLTYQHLQK